LVTPLVSLVIVTQSRKAHERRQAGAERESHRNDLNHGAVALFEDSSHLNIFLCEYFIDVVGEIKLN